MNHAIVVVFDDAYGMFARACLNSIRQNYPNYPQILAFYDGADASLKRFLADFDRLRIRSGAEMFQPHLDWDLGPVSSPMVYFKYGLFGPDFDEYDVLLHLDADTLVLKPLDELFRDDDFFIVSNHGFYPTERVFAADAFADMNLLCRLAHDGLGYPGGKDDMVNAGVFAVPKRRRQPPHRDRLVDITRTYNEYLQYADQSALSLWCRSFHIPIRVDFRYNFQSPFVTEEPICSLLDDAAIVHFSNKKPSDPDFVDWLYREAVWSKRIGRSTTAAVRERAEKLQQLFFLYTSVRGLNLAEQV